MIHPQFQNDVILSLLPFWGSVCFVFCSDWHEAFFFFFVFFFLTRPRELFFSSLPCHTPQVYPTYIHTSSQSSSYLSLSSCRHNNIKNHSVKPSVSFFLSLFLSFSLSLFLSVSFLSLFCLDFWNQEKREGWHRCPTPTSWGRNVKVVFVYYHGYFSFFFYLPELLPLFGLLVSLLLCQYHHGYQAAVHDRHHHGQRRRRQRRRRCSKIFEKMPCRKNSTPLKWNSWVILRMMVLLGWQTPR